MFLKLAFFTKIMQICFKFCINSTNKTESRGSDLQNSKRIIVHMTDFKTIHPYGN